MIKYLFKGESGGVEMSLIKSTHAYVVIYGMEKTTFDIDAPNVAWHHLQTCIEHCRHLMGE